MTSLIADARALREGPLPQELVGREAKLQELVACLRPIDRDEAGMDTALLGDDARIFGPSGSGKTTLAKMAAEKIEAEVMNTETAYVDCLSHSTTATALHDICSKLGVDGGLQYGHSPTAEYAAALRQIKMSTLVIVDEADNLEDVSIFKILYEIPSISMIVISNRGEEALFAHADPRIASRLRCGARIRLDAYSDSQIRAILENRVEYGLHDDIVTDDAYAEMAILSGGNAREAIWHLRYAVKHVQDGRAERVTASVVRAVSSVARQDLIKRVYARLDDDHREVCRTLFEYGELGAGELQARLEDRLGEMSDRTRQRLLNKIIEGSGYDLVVKRGQGPSTSYRLSDGTRELFADGVLG